jgi:tetratricopeptide (TPR) repeat protein
MTVQPRRPVPPPIPDGVDWYGLDPASRRELRGLPKELAERVGAHLVAAGLLLEDDPALARRHAEEARRLASRVPVVREATGLAAYQDGQWAEALAELRAYRRMAGDDRHLPLMADCERALGRPERALELAASPEAGRLDAAGRTEMRLVTAGARRDLGQVDAALVLLSQTPGLAGAGSSAALTRARYAYADALQAAGREDQARTWFARVAAADTDLVTDVAERLLSLDGVDFAEDDDEPATEAEPEA